MIPRAPENPVLFCEIWRDGMGDEVMRISFSDGEGWKPGGIRSMSACFFWSTFTHNFRKVLHSALFGWIRLESLRKKTLLYAYGRRKPCARTADRCDETPRQQNPFERAPPSPFPRQNK